MRARRSPEVEALLTDVVAFEVWGSGDPDWLTAEEEELVDGAVAARTAQFAAGRHCARLALAEFGVEPVSILRSTLRSPRWPEGYVGSISHTEGYAVAVVASRGGELRSLGIDAERVGRVGEKLFERLFTAEERRRLWAAEPGRRAEVATELFGLKESFYKAQYPVTEAWVGFHDVGITPEADEWVLEPATDLAALNAVRWPTIGRSVTRDEVVVTLVGVQESFDVSG